ncbi:WD40 repeat-like protein [Mycena vitilis]|nr:WD40 repeat-like protein [Mycena vitilis]
MTGMAQNQSMIRMTSDEINCLVYAFLVDSGFKHAAFSLANEARLENSPSFSKHLPRGELVKLLSNSLLYREIESHWKEDPLTINCKAGFSLLEPHVCSLEPPPDSPVTWPMGHSQRPLGQSNRINCVADGKRKATSPLGGADVPAEKRARREPDDMDTDSGYGEPEYPEKPVRQQGPGDDETNSRATLVLPGHETEVYVCAFNPVQRSILVTGSKSANLWSLPYPPSPTSSDFARPPGPPRRLEHFGDGEAVDLTALHWNNEGTLIAIGSYNAALGVYTDAGDLYFSQTRHQGPIFAVRFSKDGKWLITASLDGSVCLWDVNRKEMSLQYQAHAGGCLDIDWISDTLFSSCSVDQLIHVMRIGEAEPVKTFAGHTNEINQIKCNSSGTRLASCSDDMTARIWAVDNMSTSDESAVVLMGHKHSVTTIGWCPDPAPGTHKIVATSSWDGTARLWDSVTGECLQIFEDHQLPVYALKFSPTGRWIATGGADGWLRIYDVKSRTLAWSWFAGTEKPAVYEIDWQSDENLDRIALALECRSVAVIDVSKVPALHK